MHGLLTMDFIFGSICDRNNTVLLYVKHYLLGLTPPDEFIEIFLFLQEDLNKLRYRLNWAIYQTVICKQLNGQGFVLCYIVYDNKEQKWTVDSSYLVEPPDKTKSSCYV